MTVYDDTWLDEQVVAYEQAAEKSDNLVESAADDYLEERVPRLLDALRVTISETARLRAALEKAKRLALHEVWCDSRLKMDRDGVWRDRPCNCSTREYIADIDAALAAKEDGDAAE
jgi:hypothetical protein